MSFLIEKDWTTKAGLRAVVILVDMGHRCGYVGVPVDHPLHGIDYTTNTNALQSAEHEEVGDRGILSVLCGTERMQSPEMVFDVHGSITYAGAGEAGDYPVESDLWWFGFDCAHAGDAPAPGTRMCQLRGRPEEIHRTLEFCEWHCESLARQIVEKTVMTGAA